MRASVVAALVLGGLSLSLSQQHCRAHGSFGIGVDVEEAEAKEEEEEDGFGTSIVGGTVATDPRYRFMASLQRQTSNGYVHYCGGSLVAAGHVLTAAHCIVGKDPPARIVIGALNLDAIDNGGHVRFVAAHDIVIHPDNRGISYDAALLKLNEPVLDVEPIVVNLDFGSKDEKKGVMLRVIGWGWLFEGSGLVTKTLRQVDVPVVPLDVCKKFYSTVSQYSTSKICAGYAKGKKDSCSGDSGGPLFRDTAKGGIVQVGIVSYGRGCAQKNYYGVYARTSKLMDFVKAALTADGDSLYRGRSSLALSGAFKKLLKFCGGRKTAAKCARQTAKCFWNVDGAGEPIYTGFEAAGKTCLPLELLDGGGTGAVPTEDADLTDKVDFERAYCAKQAWSKCAKRRFAASAGPLLKRTQRCFKKSGECRSQYCNTAHPVLAALAAVADCNP